MSHVQYDRNKVLVEINGDSGLVGYKQGKLACFVCNAHSSIRCNHLKFVEKNKDNSEYPAIMELFEDARLGHRPKYQRVCYSTSTISFEGTSEYLRKVTSRPRDYLQLDQVLQSTDKLCKSCGADLGDSSHVGEDEAILVSEYEVQNVKG